MSENFHNWGKDTDTQSKKPREFQLRWTQRKTYQPHYNGKS